MAVFPSFKLTKKGEELLNRSIGEGKVLTFTKFEIGDGNPPSDFREQTSLVNKFYQFPVLSTDIQKNQILRIKGYFDNKSFTGDKQLKEIGVFVKIENDETEYLYSYTNAGESGDIIPGNTRGFYSRTLDVANYIGYATNITFNIEQLRDRYAFNTENEMKVASYLKAGDKVELWGNLVLGDKPTDEYIIQDKGEVLLDNKLYAKKLSKKYIAGTISELQKLNLKENDVVEVLGYYTAGDGAGHERIIKNEDDGSGIQLNNSKWANMIDDKFGKITWFGCRGNGEDESMALEKAIKYFEKIDFCGKTILKNNSEFIKAKEKNIDWGNGKIIINGKGFLLEGCKIKITDFEIEQKDNVFDQYKHSLAIYSSSLKIENVIFNNFKGDAISENGKSLLGYSINKPSEFMIENCLFDGKNNDNRNAIAMCSATSVIINNCTFINCCKDNMPGAIDIEYENGKNNNAPKTVIIKNNIFKKCRIGIIYQNNATYETETETSIIIKNNNFTENKHSDIVIEDNNNTLKINIYANQFEKGGFWDSNTGNIRLYSKYSYCFISNNIVKNSGNGFLRTNLKYNNLTKNYFKNLFTDVNTILFGALTFEGQGTTDEFCVSENVFDNAGKPNANGYIINIRKSEYTESENLVFKLINNTIINNSTQSTPNRLCFNTASNKKAKIYAIGNSIDSTDYKLYNFEEVELKNMKSPTLPIIDRLNTPTMLYAMRMEDPKVETDFLNYSIEKMAYDKEVAEKEKTKILAYEEALKENPDLTWEEFEEQNKPRRVRRSLVLEPQEPQIPESVQNFINKYL